MSLSLCMIVKNEENTLKNCLKSVENIFDEIIIVDTGSSDKTKIVAKSFNAKVYDFEWVNDFSKARNYSFSKATCDYIMWLDADDIIKETDKIELIKFKEILKKQDYGVVYMPYNIAFDNNNQPTFSFFRERIVKRSKNFVWKDAVHEVLEVDGKIFKSKIAICHNKDKNKKYTDRNLKIYENMKKENVKFSARQKYYYARELMFNEKYSQAICNFNIALGDEKLWEVNRLSCYLDLNYCYLKLNQNQKAMNVLFDALKIFKPNAEICCKIADGFLNNQKYETAIFWYKLALKDKFNIKSGAFVQKDYYGLYPYLQMCLTYFKMGKIKLANLYNEKVGKINNKNEIYLNNKKYFENLQSK